MSKLYHHSQKHWHSTDKEYYVTEEGEFVRYDEKTDKFLQPGDDGFSDVVVDSSTDTVDTVSPMARWRERSQESHSARVSGGGCHAW